LDSSIKEETKEADSVGVIMGNLVNIRERGQEMVASGEITQKQLDESLKIYDETKSMEAVNKYLQDQKKTVSDKDKAIMKAEKESRIRAKNKANPMGKATGGHVKSSAEGSTIKMNHGGKVKGKGSMLSITIEQKPINKKTMNMIKQAEKTGNVVKMNSGGLARRGYGKARR